MAPYPLTDGAFGHLEWSEDEGEELEELEAQEMYHEVEEMVVAERPREVELDEVTFSEKMSVKELQMACKERQLAHTGSKKKLLERLVAFKVNLENQMHLAVANKLYNEQKRRPVTLGQPKLPSLAEQELHNVTRWPFASVASRSKEDKHEKSENKEDIGKNIIQIDFCYTYTGEEDRSEKPVQDKVVERQDQRGPALRQRPSTQFQCRANAALASRPSRKRSSDLLWRILPGTLASSRLTARGQPDKYSGPCNTSAEMCSA